MSEPLVIVGASYAGLQTALSARTAGFDGPVLLIGDETHLPYQRPPLSKGYLNGKVAESALPIRPQQVLDSNRIETMPGTRVTAIDRAARTIATDTGRHISYGHLALATGCRARPLPVPGADLEGMHYLRTLDDARALRERTANAEAVAIIGGGFIGLEIAASLIQLGKTVTIIEAQDHLLSRAVPRPLAEFLADVHRDAGARILTGTTVRSLGGERGHVRSIELSDGSQCRADLAVVGIGAIANTELAAAAGLICDDGIVVDAFARTSDPLIVAAGDCTRFPSRLAQRPVRLESVQNALDQAKTAGSTLAGAPKPYHAVPWFWSDQYELKLQMVGFSQGHDRVVTRGEPAERKFSLFYFKDNKLIAIDSVNRAGDHMAGRNLIGTDNAITPEKIADQGFDLAAAVAEMRKTARAPG